MNEKPGTLVAVVLVARGKKRALRRKFLMNEASVALCGRVNVTQNFPLITHIYLTKEETKKRKKMRQTRAMKKKQRR